MLWFAFIGCEGDTVTLTGTVFESHDPLSAPLADAELAIVDFAGKPLAEASTDGQGEFVATVPVGTSVFVEVTAEGYAVTAFPGVIGYALEQEVDHHALYGVSDEVRADWLARFDGCPGAGDDRAMVIGEMRVYGIEDPYTGESPTVGTGIVTVADADDELASGCYFDEDGLLYDPEADVTGASGQFAVFGIVPGLHDLQLEGVLSASLSTTEAYPLWIPDRPDVVSPWFPAWLPFAF